MDLLELAVAEEADLVWHDDPLRYPYLRQTPRLCFRRTGVIGQGDSWANGSRVVGYSVLRPDAARWHRDKWVRRIFWCKLSDRDGERSGPPAQEAVDPRAIRPRELTPWLFDDHDEVPRVLWLAARRAELGLSPGQAVSAWAVLDRVATPGVE